jgi:colanic acid/amylovoran biosynthesis protein
MVHAFPSLDNYGTGMMGLITIDRLRRMIDGPVAVDTDFFDRTHIEEVHAELGTTPDELTLGRTPYRPHWWRPGPVGEARGLLRAVRERGYDDYALVVFLGGDDLSEYYQRNIWQRIVNLRVWGLKAPLVLLGQTIGPFHRPLNRLAARSVFRNFHIFPRDQWCTEYLQKDLGLAGRVEQSSDLAFADLPLQGDTGVERDILARYGLEPDRYVTLVVSAMQGSGYYTRDRAAYLSAWKGIGERLLGLEPLRDCKLVLLAHTFTDYYGHEPAYVADLLPLFDPALRPRVVPIAERILQTRARFVLGNGRLTITGRMHPAVSTFQMGRPAVSLAYSKKYEGVIGTMLGRSDLIVEANDPALWESGAIVDLAVARAEMALGRGEALRAEIRTTVDRQKAILDGTFARLGALLGR